MKNITTIIIVVVILALITGFFYKKQSSPVTQDVVQNELQATSTSTSTEKVNTPSSGTSSGIPKFAWTLKLGSKNGEAQTTVSLTATYPNKSKVTKTIATVPGTCNTYDDRDANAFKNSTMIMCYSAGAGTYFKIVNTASGYEVQKKDFEEAVPGYNPPARSYQTVTTFK